MWHIFFSPPDPFPHPNTTFLVLDTMQTGCPNLVTQSLSMIISQNGPDLAMKTFFFFGGTATISCAFTL